LIDFHNRLLIRFLTVAGLVGVMLGCAEIVPPPGGPEDKQGPFLLGSEPANGAVAVRPGNTVTLYFSEPVVQPRKGKSVFISPRPSAEPKVHWKTDRIIVEFPDSFSMAGTHVVSAAAAISDLRGNQIDSGLTVAFTRGPQIDLGRVSGRVFAESNKPASGLLVSLYTEEPSTDGGYDSLYGRYITETNTEGYFSLEHLTAREYRLIAFRDSDNDERLQATRESYALTDRPVVVTSDHSQGDLVMTLRSVDTSAVEILSASTTPDGLLRVRLSREIVLDALNNNPALAILRAVSDTLLMTEATAFQERGNERAASLNLWFGPVPSGTYELQLTYDSQKAPVVYPGLERRDFEDDTQPTILRTSVDKSIPVLLKDFELEVTFSEALDTTLLTEQSLAVIETEGEQSLPVTWSWSDPLHLMLTPSGLEAGRDYRLDITEFELADGSGNVLGDSLRSYAFSITDEDDLGSISGEVRVLVAGREDDPTVITAENVDTRAVYRETFSPGPFHFKLPGGKYILSGFVDSDADGISDLGRLDPFEYAETKALHADTIAVRSRFETAGIEFIID